MKRAIFAGSALVVAATAIVSASGARAPKTRILSVTKTPIQGKPVKLVAAVRPPVRTTCSATYRSPARRTTRLPARRTTKAGTVFWTWRLTSQAAVGRWPVAVICRRGGRATSFFVVRKAPPPPERVVVGPSGASIATSSSISYGVVLTNASPGMDAVGLGLAVTILDASNRIIASEAGKLAWIPAAERFYYGGATSANSAWSTPLRLRAVVTVESWRPAELVLPPVNNVAVERFGFDTTTVVGEFSNPYAQELGALTRARAVVFDSAGVVLGGGSTFPITSLASGARTSFRIPASAIPIEKAASARASIEPP
jgi:hypothetical protein